MNSSLEGQYNNMIDKDFNIFLQYLEVYYERHSLCRSFIKFPYHERLLNTIENNRFTVFSKPRQGGFTTFLTAWALWKGLTEFDKTIVMFSPFDRMALSNCSEAAKMLDVNAYFLANVTKQNGHSIEFNNGSTIHFFSAEAAKGKGIDYCILDEAAFYRSGGLNQFYKGVFPCIKRGGKIIIGSSLNQGEPDEDFSFRRMLKRPAYDDFFTLFKCSYLEIKGYYETYLGKDWEKFLKTNLGELGFQLEYLQEYIAWEMLL